ncbi:MAG: hypothetical protein HY336_01735 [Candidatus Doudnabacteria bacterium]|nr:hypothetical protein [Candidatus Doudnabacteria bacterium]
MKKLQQLLAKVQNKPYETKLKILWSTTLLVGILLISLWLLDLKSTVSKLGNNDSPQTNNSAVTSKQFIKLERAEVADGSTKIFFSASNDTDDILNFSTINDIRLDVSKSGVKPAKILDRQSKPFVQKILSKSQEFGTLVFSGSMEGSGEIIFDQLYFEKHPESLFKEIIQIDFDGLAKNQELRN